MAKWLARISKIHSKLQGGRHFFGTRRTGRLEERCRSCRYGSCMNGADARSIDSLLHPFSIIPWLITGSKLDQLGIWYTSHVSHLSSPRRPHLQASGYWTRPPPRLCPPPAASIARQAKEGAEKFGARRASCGIFDPGVEGI